MSFNRFPIDRFSTGWQNNVEPQLIPDDAFSIMRNCNIYRQRVVKRFGSKYLNDVDTQRGSRLRMQIGTVTTSPEVFNIPVPGALAIGQMFSVNDTLLTVYRLGPGVGTYTTGAITATVNSTVSPNTIEITGAAVNDIVYWYPSQPVMGIRIYEQSDINNERTIWFDQNFAYEFDPGTIGFERIGGANSTWSGSDSQFYWTTTWRGAAASDRLLFVVNYNQPDQMRYYNGAVWSNFRPATRTLALNFLYNARIVVVFKNRLVFLNTIEQVSTDGMTSTVQTFVNRARASRVGDPLGVDAFNTTIPGEGISIDAATTEAIVTVGFYKDRLIVYFERSTWELVYTGNQIYPFVWQKINNELGAESTHSAIETDDAVLGVGNVGVHASNGTNVARIDGKIPQEVFKIHDDNQGVFRVYGIRDYFREMVYWSFPSATESDFPNRVLVYNYIERAWAVHDDTITCFGYFQPSQGITWNSTTVTWDDPEPWDSGALQARFRQVVGGNQSGFCFIIDSEKATNAPRLQITNMTTAGVLTIISHNLQENEFIRVTDAVGITELNDTIFRIINVTTDTLTLDLNGVVPTGVYQGGGLAEVVSRVDLVTKQYNFFAQQGRNAYIQKADFLVSRNGDTTSTSRITVDYSTSSSIQDLIDEAATTDTLQGTGQLDLSPYALFPAEQKQLRIWHPVYILAEGEVIQLRIYYSNEDMLNEQSSRWDFQLHSIIYSAQPTSRLQ